MCVHRPIRLLRKLFAFPVVVYRHVISPHLPAACRYSPTCSRYTEESILKHGFLRGSVLGLSRILRCNGCFHGGDDPVPESFSWAYMRQEYRNRRASKESGSEHQHLQEHEKQHQNPHQHHSDDNQ
ncbi:MAG: membrane protein insertion efficiency factor YidD [Spirochaetaceae bacterium]|nr:MAG: membrane protein insertion efficiency factor YidD [Spirochaetaceae bacterium]